jgi:hypothetical protein
LTDEINIVLRFNAESEEVELVVGDEVAGSSGKDEFKSWVEHYNEKHPEVKVIQEVVQPAPVVEEKVVVEPEVPAPTPEKPEEVQE